MRKMAVARWERITSGCGSYSETVLGRTSGTSVWYTATSEVPGLMSPVKNAESSCEAEEARGLSESMMSSASVLCQHGLNVLSTGVT